MTLRLAAVVVSIVGLLVSCARNPQPRAMQAEHRYAMDGVVTGLDSTAQAATIRHGRIQDSAGKVWMEPMTMDFPVPDRREFANLKTGQRIAGIVFTRSGGLEYWLGDIKIQADH